MTHAVVHQAKVIISYHYFVVAGRAHMECSVQEAAALIPGGNPVGVLNPIGFAVRTRSDWGPVTISLQLGGDGEPTGDTIWSGEVEFAEADIYVESFDQLPEELFVRLPRGAGRYHVTVAWSYSERPVPDDVELPDGQLTPEQEENPIGEDFWESIAVRIS